MALPDSAVRHPHNVTLVAPVVLNPRILAGTREDSAEWRDTAGRCDAALGTSGENASIGDLILPSDSVSEAHHYRRMPPNFKPRLRGWQEWCSSHRSNGFIHAGHAA